MAAIAVPPAGVEVGATAPSFAEVTLLSSPNALLWRGLPAVVVGIVSVSWPGIAVGAFVVPFAVYAFVYAVVDGVRAFSGDRGDRSSAGCCRPCCRSWPASAPWPGRASRPWYSRSGSPRGP